MLDEWYFEHSIPNRKPASAQQLLSLLRICPIAPIFTGEEQLMVADQMLNSEKAS